MDKVNCNGIKELVLKTDGAITDTYDFCLQVVFFSNQKVKAEKAIALINALKDKDGNVIFSYDDEHGEVLVK